MAIIGGIGVRCSWDATSGVIGLRTYTAVSGRSRASMRSSVSCSPMDILPPLCAIGVGSASRNLANESSRNRGLGTPRRGDDRVALHADRDRVVGHEAGARHREAHREGRLSIPRWREEGDHAGVECHGASMQCQPVVQMKRGA